MPLNNRYNTAHMRTLLQQHCTGESWQKGDSYQPMDQNDQISPPAYYEKDGIYVCDTASDVGNISGTPTKSIGDVLALLDKEEEKNNIQKIIIPVQEERWIFPFVRRNHWVTLHYDVTTSQATLIDSRPWWISMFYPKRYMKKMLQQSVQKLFGAEKARNMTFTRIDQNVQHNDTYCGTWTMQNIRDLSASTAVPTNQKNQYTAQHEVNLYTDNMKYLGGWLYVMSETQCEHIKNDLESCYVVVNATVKQASNDVTVNFTDNKTKVRHYTTKGQYTDILAANIPNFTTELQNLCKSYPDTIKGRWELPMSVDCMRTIVLHENGEDKNMKNQMSALILSENEKKTDIQDEFVVIDNTEEQDKPKNTTQDSQPTTHPPQDSDHPSPKSFCTIL